MFQLRTASLRAHTLNRRALSRGYRVTFSLALMTAEQHRLFMPPLGKSVLGGSGYIIVADDLPLYANVLLLKIE